MPFYAGKNASFTLGGVTYKMKQWSLSVEYSRIDVTNFESPSDWREFLNGFASGTLSASGPYDPTQATVSPSSSVAFSALVGSTYAFIGNCFVTKIQFSTDVDNAAQVSYEAAITGSVDLDLSS